MKRNYINCSKAAEATDKIIINDGTFYFASLEDASDWLNELANKGDFRYEWMEREVNWETGEYLSTWTTIEMGNTAHIRAFKASFGL